MADQNANARAETATDSRGRARSVSPDCSELPASFANDAISRRSRSQYADEIADDLDLIGIVQRREIHPRSVSSTPLLNIAPTWTALADQVERTGRGAPIHYATWRRYHRLRA